jgi:hypothetical protein
MRGGSVYPGGTGVDAPDVPTSGSCDKTGVPGSADGTRPGLAVLSPRSDLLSDVGRAMNALEASAGACPRFATSATDVEDCLSADPAAGVVPKISGATAAVDGESGRVRASKPEGEVKRHEHHARQDCRHRKAASHLWRLPRSPRTRTGVARRIRHARTLHGFSLFRLRELRPWFQSCCEWPVPVTGVGRAPCRGVGTVVAAVGTPAAAARRQDGGTRGPSSAER